MGPAAAEHTAAADAARRTADPKVRWAIPAVGLAPAGEPTATATATAVEATADDHVGAPVQATADAVEATAAATATRAKTGDYRAGEAKAGEKATANTTPTTNNEAKTGDAATAIELVGGRVASPGLVANL